ncbi:hypothetical protein I862_05395 [endosymbiont of Acanthamoeba sp. UWC8]|nr:hypothetical protein I862_05395 [endosymbiont of Acanthamoeba sp. UWC8]
MDQVEYPTYSKLSYKSYSDIYLTRVLYSKLKIHKNYLIIFMYAAPLKEGAEGRVTINFDNKLLRLSEGLFK